MPFDLKQQRENSRRSAHFANASMGSPVMPMHFKDLQHLTMTACFVKLHTMKAEKNKSLLER